MGQSTQESSESRSASQDTRRRLIRRLVVPVLLLLAIIAIVLVLVRRYADRLQPTGDTLFDRYAAAVNERINSGEHGYGSIGFRQASQSGFAGAIPDETLAAWEPEFGSDPRYWELRYICAEQGSGISAGAAEQGFSTPADFLFEAVSRGVATSTTRLLIYEVERDRLEGELDLLPSHESFADYTADELQLVREANARVESEELALLDLAVAEDPGQSWPHYWRAFYWFNLGEQELALQELEQGNVAPRGDYPYPFPISYVMAELKAGNTPGSRPVCGAVWELAVAYHLPNFIAIKDALKETLAALELGLDYPAAANAWEEYACSLGQDPGTLIGSLVAVVLIGIVDSWYLDDHSAELTEEQVAVLEQHQVARRVITYRVKDFRSENDVLGAYPLQLILNPVTGYYVASYKDQRQEIEICNEVSAIFSDLERLDFTTLTMPAGLEKYRFTPEQQKKEDERLARIRARQE